MVNFPELQARLKDYFRFNQRELISLVLAIIITALIFSFRDWGEEQFNLMLGLENLFLVLILVAVSFFFKFSCQKIYALKEGYKAEFKVWWAGLLIALAVAVISNGKVPLVLVGAVATSLMVRQRLGEFRYGYSHFQNAVISLWGILGSLLAALLFAIGLYFFPDSFFFGKGLVLNLIMAFCSLLPVPQLEGLQIYFGSYKLYLVTILIVFLAAALLVTRTTAGLIIAIIAGSVYGIFLILTGSEK